MCNQDVYTVHNMGELKERVWKREGRRREGEEVRIVRHKSKEKEITKEYDYIDF